VHDVILSAAHREQDDRGTSLRADLPVDGKAVEPGYIDVQHDEVGLLFGPAPQGSLAIGQVTKLRF
jgi:hypothetical protein